MPELPEVEVTRRGIAGPLHGARVQALRLGKPLRWPLGVDASSLAGRQVGEVSRRGKYLWLPLEGGRRDAGHGSAKSQTAAPATPPGGGLLLHLGMSGSLRWWPAAAGEAGAPPPGPHDHADLVTDRGTLRLNDPRRFGAVVWSPGLDQGAAATLLARLGPEPFDPMLSPARFHAALRARRSPVKQVLLSGEAVVGAGNIYACEALFLAGIHPALRADRVSAPRADRLLAAVRQTLAQALQLGGSTLRDFADVHGVGGAYQAQAAVYGREGQPCPRCGAPVKRRVMAQRSTYFCASCQRR